MRKIFSFLLVIVLSFGMIGVNVSGAEKSEKPVIGIAWRSDVDSEFFTYVTASIELAGGEWVLLDQVKSADLKYKKSGKLKSGVAKTGALTKAAGKKVRLNSWHDSNAQEVLENVDAVIFTGGEDISPSLYYKQVKWHGIEEERDYNAERDVSDYLTMTYCLDMNIPILGLCRGMQMLGVVSGAEVIQDIPTYFEKLGKEYNFEHRNVKETPDAFRDFASHDVKVAENSFLYDIVGKDTISGCPSWHHQAIKNVDNTRLNVTGTLNVNGVEMIEAIERPDRLFAVGIQFHPEAAVAKNIYKADNAGDYMSLKEDLSFFEYLVDFVKILKETDSALNEAGQSGLQEYDIQYVLYLGTNDKDTNKPVFSQDDAKSKAEEILLKHFGGYTIQEADGGWVDGDTVYQEYSLVIYLSDVSDEQVHEAADELIKAFNQSAVMIQANPTKTEFYGG